MYNELNTNFINFSKLIISAVLNIKLKDILIINIKLCMTISKTKIHATTTKKKISKMHYNYCQILNYKFHLQNII